MQPCITYFAWQIEVMLTNFKELGIHEKHNIQILCAYNKNESDWAHKISIMEMVGLKFKDIASFYYYQDTREYPIQYISGIRPNLLQQHFAIYPELSNDAIFYHDCDIVFTEYPLFLDDDDFIQNDNNYVSDTLSYLNHTYIFSKGHGVLNKMCDIVGISPSLVEEKNNEAGGAQYILKNIDTSFWHKVEKDCEKLFKEITTLNNEIKKTNPEYHELQIWCADMWAIVWNLWVLGKNSLVIKEMGFCWATDPIDRWQQAFIFHNAGVVGEARATSFFKGGYTEMTPFELDGSGFNKETCGYLQLDNA